MKQIGAQHKAVQPILILQANKTLAGLVGTDKKSFFKVPVGEENRRDTSILLAGVILDQQSRLLEETMFFIITMTKKIIH